MKLVLVLFLLLAGCMAPPGVQKIYHVTCWNGGKIIFDETVALSPVWKQNTWETLDGKEAYIPHGDVACITRLLRTEQLKEAP